MLDFVYLLVIIVLLAFFLIVIKIFGSSEKKDKSITYNNSDLTSLHILYSLILYHFWFIIFVFTCLTFLPIVMLSKAKSISPIVRFY